MEGFIGFCIGIAAYIIISIPGEKEWMKYAYRKAYRQAIEDLHKHDCKPIILRRYEEFFNWFSFKCPECGVEIVSDEEKNNNYCSNCGCKFKWEEDDDK